jgi:hypothetical protein
MKDLHARGFVRCCKAKKYFLFYRKKQKTLGRCRALVWTGVWLTHVALWHQLRMLVRIAGFYSLSFRHGHGKQSRRFTTGLMESVPFVP